MSDKRAPEILNEAIRIITGSDEVDSRPSQYRLMQQIDGTMSGLNGPCSAMAPTGIGKALDVETPIPVPSGWTRMGDLVVGDKVFDENGQICNVTHVHPVRENRDCYELTFSDRTVIVADAEHLWPTSTRKLRLLQSWSRRKTPEKWIPEWLIKIAALQEILDALNAGDAKMTYSEAKILTTGLIDSKRISIVQKKVNGTRLQLNEKFDFSVVLSIIIDEIAATVTKRTLAPPVYEVMTTAEMAATAYSGEDLNHAVIVADALVLSEVALPIHPYTFGAWLGDGSSGNSQITSADSEIIDNIRSDGYFVKKLKAKYSYGISMTEVPVNNKWVDSLAKTLRAMDVRNNKRIPTAYLRSGFDQRLALLQGLMDTDGTISHHGRCEFVVVNEQLALGALELVRSLGIRAAYTSGPAAITQTINGQKVRRECGTRYRVGFTTSLPVFRLARKFARLPLKDTEQTKFRYIKSIEKVDSRPVRCITVDSSNHLFLASQAMIPTRNSMAYLAPAAYAASMGERTVISTESLALQSQLVDKDAPVIQEASERITGYRPSVAVLKGFGNYSCSAKTVETAEAMLGHDLDNPADKAKSKARAITDPRGRMQDLITELERLDPADHPNLELTKWALSESVSDKTGDKFAFQGETTFETWDSVSISSAECIGVKRCPFADQCMPHKSRRVASNADIVITNHTMIGIQAAKSVPIVIGNRTLGVFHNVVIDEAHALPSIVRNQGSSFVSALRIYQATSSLKGVFDTHDNEVKDLIDEGNSLGDAVDIELTTWTQNLADGKVTSLSEGDNPLNAIEARANRWIKKIKEALDRALDISSANEIRVRRLKSRFDDLSNSVKDCSEHQPGTARWVEIEKPRSGGNKSWPVVRYTPVDISSPLEFNVWTATDGLEEMEVETVELNEDDTEAEYVAPRRRLNITAVSATLPVSFCRDVGLKTTTGQYESPFDDAFSKSALFVPRAVDEADVLALSGDSGGYGKPRFNTRLHADWAAAHMVRLVEANGGSTLVLSATASAGRQYAEHLRTASKGRWKVISQWDGLSIRNATQQWKDDPSAVLVGTRSLMTGVDAPGETNTLVIIDRIPRAASNPVDDARVEKLIQDADFDKWSADRFVYGGDAALLLAQASGRLIRSFSDSGMVAVLDPRLLKVGKMLYPKPTRELYLKSLRMFPKRISDHGKAVQWLTDHRNATS